MIGFLTVVETIIRYLGSTLDYMGVITVSVFIFVEHTVTKRSNTRMVSSSNCSVENDSVGCFIA